MFLLPALGAWITDGLVLYLYFSAARGVGEAPRAGGGGAAVAARGGRGVVPPSHGRVPTPPALPPPFLRRRGSARGELPRPSPRAGGDGAGGGVAASAAAPLPADGPAAREDGGLAAAAAIESHVGYLPVLAGVRLALLTFPLNYAAYTGTRVPCATAQHAFHGASALVVVSPGWPPFCPARVGQIAKAVASGASPAEGGGGGNGEKR